jgi:hypothetical protein
MPRQNNIMLFASEVPVVAALNRFRGINEVFETVWKRTAPQAHSAALDGLLAQGVTVEEKDVQVARLLTETDLAKPMRLIREKAKLSDSVEEVATFKKEVQQLIKEADAPKEVKLLLQEHETSEIQKDFGSRQEHSAIGSYEKRTQKRVKARNDIFYKREVGMTGTTNGRKVLVGGRVDGLVGDKVIEVKNRIDRLPDSIPDYDIAQLNVYLFLVEKQQGEMVENLRTKQNIDGDDIEPTQRVTNFDFDDEMWNSLLVPRIMQFSHALDLFLLEEPNVHMDYMAIDDPQAKQQLIKPYWLEATQQLRMQQS